MSTQGDLKVHSPDLTSRRYYACVRDSRLFSSHIPLLARMVSHILWYLKETLRDCPIVNSCLVYVVGYWKIVSAQKWHSHLGQFLSMEQSLGFSQTPALGSLPWGACIPVAKGGNDLWNPGIFKFWNLKAISSFQKYPSWAPCHKFITSDFGFFFIKVILFSLIKIG